MPQRRFNTRPDRLDFRDRLYLPPLVALPAASPDPTELGDFWEWYLSHDRVLDQNDVPSCTGHALAGLISFRAYRQAWRKGAAPGHDMPEAPAADPPSPEMLYALARLYDEIEGEDHDGSSCRGAMKGWHQHGVLGAEDWEALLAEGPRAARSLMERQGIAEALRRPGAYYRVKVTDIDDVRAAIVEADAVYASLRVHAGWEALEDWSDHDDPRRLDRLALEARPRIAMPAAPDRAALGGHAVCLVGYDADGLILQNSWGPRWGLKGLAWIGYDDWFAHAMDAWVAVEGAPLNLGRLPERNADLGLIVRVSASRGLAGIVAVGRSEQAVTIHAPGDAPGPSGRGAPWPAQRAAAQMLTLGNDGRAIQRRLDLRRALETSLAEEGAVSHAMLYRRECEKAAQTVKTALLSGSTGTSAGEEQRSDDLAVIFGNGFEGEDAAQQAYRSLGAAFERAGIASVYMDWEDALWPILADRVIDWSESALDAAPRAMSLAWWESYTNDYPGALDRLMEAAARKLVGPALWYQRSATAQLATERLGAVNCLARVCTETCGGARPRVHLVAHSTGAILACWFVMSAARLHLPIASVGLVAPACTFALPTSALGLAFRRGLLAPERVHLHVLPDERERATSDMKPYSKSALYFISNALEVRPRTALLGLESAWWPAPRQEAHGFDMEERARFDAWVEAWPPAASAARAKTRVDRIAALTPNLRRIGHETLVCNGTPHPMSHRMLLQDDRILAAVLEDIRTAALTPSTPTTQTDLPKS